MEEQRPNPDVLLEAIGHDTAEKIGKLHIFFGYAAGVGKTYAMLDEAHQQIKNGKDVLVGYVEPHTRPETMELLEGLPLLPPLTLAYKGITLKEFDLDAALSKKPDLVLEDELAHTNAPACRNKKRYQDIEELLQAGIDVYATVNVQHIESLNDIVQDITDIAVRETVPDYIFDNADVRLIDIPPDELLKRFESGKIYKPERATAAMERFFSKENLNALREIAMRKTADRVSHENQPESGAKPAGMRFLVCITAAPSSAKCIRWGARIAEAMHAPWTVLYVETSRHEYDSDAQKKALRDHMDLAERLGGDVVTLYGDNVAEVVAEYANTGGITNIVIGKNNRITKNLFKLDFEDQLINKLANIEIHIISDRVDEKRERKQPMILSARFLFSWTDSLKTLGMLVLATVLSFGLRAVNIGDQNVIMVYILSVLVVSRITQGYLSGIIASVLSVLLFNFFFTDPLYTFNAVQPGYPITFVIMLVVALFTSALTMRIKTQARTAVSRERRTEVRYVINKKLLVTRGLANIVELVNDYIVNLFERSVIFYTADPLDGNLGLLKQAPADGDAAFMHKADEQAVAQWVFVNQKRAGAGTDTLMGAGGFYMPLLSQGKLLGVIGISCAGGAFLSQDNRLFLRMIGSLVAMALERQLLSDEQRKILLDSDREQMRGNLLRAISHDLRTPLTSIVGASSALLEKDNPLDGESARTLINAIKEDSQWLIRMVENLLAVTRIKEGNLSVNKVAEAVEEIVAEAVSRTKRRFPDRSFHASAPEELLVIPMDGTLIIQVLMNLFENAIKHSGSETTVDVAVKKVGDSAVFEVSDNGAGIPPQDLPYLFESRMPAMKKNGDSSRGMGIGLSICMSIVKAHGGTMQAENKREGGAVFRFTLPL